jgi:hypothetical protein
MVHVATGSVILLCTIVQHGTARGHAATCCNTLQRLTAQSNLSRVQLVQRASAVVASDSLMSYSAVLRSRLALHDCAELLRGSAAVAEQ